MLRRVIKPILFLPLALSINSFNVLSSERNYIVNISQNYSRIYTKDYFLNADGITSWNNGALKFGDAFASICYLHGIYPETVFNEWDVLNDHFPEIGDLGKGENHPYTHKEQVEFILKYKTRILGCI